MSQPIKVKVLPAEGPRPDLGELAEKMLEILAEELERKQREAASNGADHDKARTA